MTLHLKIICLFISLMLFLGCSSKKLNTDSVNSSTRRSLSSESKFKYKFYDSWEAAKENYESYYIRRGPVLLNQPKAYQRVNAIVDDVLKSYIELFPFLAQSFVSNKFWAVLYESEKYSASAGYNKVNEEQDMYIMLSAALHRRSDAVIYGVVAHEMGHALLQRYSKNEDNVIPKTFYYNIENVDMSQRLFPGIDIDEELEYLMAMWINYSIWAGEFSDRMFKGVALTHDSDEVFLLEALYRVIQANGCPRMTEKLKSIQNFTYWLNRYGADSAIHKRLVHSDRLKIIKLMDNFKKGIQKCLGNEKIDFFQSWSDVLLDDNKISKEKLKNNMYKQLEQHPAKDFYLKAFKLMEDYPLKDAFYKIIQSARFEMRKIEEKINFNSISRYTVEDHADELSVLVLDHLNIPYEDFFRSLGEINPMQAVCNTVPVEKPYSPINQKHHSQCWRFWRASQLDKGLKMRKSSAK